MEGGERGIYLPEGEEQCLEISNLRCLLEEDVKQIAVDTSLKFGGKDQG